MGGNRGPVGRTVEVGVVLELVAEERARDVDLLAADDRDLLARQDLFRGHSVVWIEGRGGVERAQSRIERRRWSALGQTKLCGHSGNLLESSCTSNACSRAASDAAAPATGQHRSSPRRNVLSTLFPRLFPLSLPPNPSPSAVPRSRRFRIPTCLERIEARRPRRWPLPSITMGVDEKVDISVVQTRIDKVRVRVRVRVRRWMWTSSRNGG